MDSTFDQLYFNRMHVADLSAALSEYSPKDLKSPFRPSVPLLALLKDRYDIMEGLMSDLGMPRESEHHLEYAVEPGKGNGKASRTDLMLRHKDSSIAFVAKWTEPHYESVSEWFVRVGDNPNSHLVFTGWLKQIQKHAKLPLLEGNFHEAVYEMVHQAASACYQSALPQLAYIVFTPSSDPESASPRQYLEDLSRLHALLGGPEDFKFHVVDIAIEPGPAFDAISDLPKGLVATSVAVRKAIKENELFTFGKATISSVS